MKQTILLLALVSLSASIYSQDIPNASFETWGIYNTWTLEPESWETVNSQLLELVTIDSSAYVGDKAMRVTGLPLTEPIGYARVGFPASSIPDNLGFFVKTEAEGFPFFLVACKFYYQGNIVEEQSWDTSETISSWTYQEFTFENTDAMVDSASIRVEAMMGDFVQAEGWISVDGFGFAGVNNLEEQEQNKILIYPNPAVSELHVQGDIQNITELKVYDVSGKLVLDTQAQYSIDISHLSSGKFLIQWTYQNGDIRQTEFLKTH